MQPPPSPTRNTRTHSRGATPSVTSSIAPSSTALSLSTAAPGNANPAVSAALQGATLAFNKQKKAAVAGSSTSSGGGGGGNTNGRGPSPSSHGSNQKNIGIGTYANTNTSTGSGLAGMTASQGSAGLRSGNGALLAATQAAKGHAAAAAASSSKPQSAGSQPGNASGGGREAGYHPAPSPSSGLEGGHVHGSLVAQRLSELHAGGGAGRLSPAVGMLHAGGDNQAPSTSPSLIAATLAASRSASPVRAAIPQLDLNGGRAVTRGRGQSVGSASLMGSSVGLGMGWGEVAGDKDALDTASIPPTTSLVSLFEGKRAEEDVDPVKKRAPSLRPRSPDGGDQAWRERHQQERQVVKPRPKPKPKPKPKPTLPTDSGRPGPSDEADESPQRVSQTKHARRVDHLPPQSPTKSQTNGDQPARKPKPRVDKRPSTPTSSAPTQGSSNHISPHPKKLVKTPRLEPPTPPARTSGIAKMTEPTVHITPVDSENDHVRELDKVQGQALASRRLSQDSDSSTDTFVSASSVQSRPISPIKEVEKRPGRPAQLTRNSSIRSISNPDLQRPPAPHASTPNLPLNSLTNAIVASNLASARLTPTTPSQRPPVPPPRRAGRSHTGSHSPLQPQRTADSILSQLTSGSKSPNRQTQQRTGMLQTLRSPQPSLSDDEDARRRLHHHRRRNKVLGGGNRKHAHHEGSRRRWRDEITARERRRYEAVWASNKGLFLRPGWGLLHHHEGGGEDEGASQRQHDQYQAQVDRSRALDGPESDLVANVVVRDIWSRSRLPADELAEMWDLVDRHQRGRLGRDEFVVGMWLIDQRLRGRKIPARVSQSVWESAGAGASGGLGLVVPPPTSSSSGSGKGRGKRGR